MELYPLRALLGLKPRGEPGRPPLHAGEGWEGISHTAGRRGATVWRTTSLQKTRISCVVHYTLQAVTSTDATSRRTSACSSASLKVSSAGGKGSSTSGGSSLLDGWEGDELETVSVAISSACFRSL